MGIKRSRACAISPRHTICICEYEWLGICMRWSQKASASSPMSADMDIRCRTLHMHNEGQHASYIHALACATTQMLNTGVSLFLPTSSIVMLSLSGALLSEQRQVLTSHHTLLEIQRGNVAMDQCQPIWLLPHAAWVPLAAGGDNACAVQHICRMPWAVLFSFRSCHYPSTVQLLLQLHAFPCVCVCVRACVQAPWTVTSNNTFENPTQCCTPICATIALQTCAFAQNNEPASAFHSCLRARELNKSLDCLMRTRIVIL